MSTTINSRVLSTATQPNIAREILHMNPKLIVLIPPGLDTSRMPHRIWKLADATNMSVLLLGLGGNDANEHSLRRGMVTLAAMLRSEKVATDIKFENITNWVKAVGLHYRSGDMIVCPADNRIGIFRRSLGEILKAKLNAPIYILSNQEPQDFAPTWKLKIMAWSGFIGLLIGFGVLQIRIVHLTGGGFQTILLLLSTILEYWLFGVWSNLVH